MQQSFDKYAFSGLTLLDAHQEGCLTCEESSCSMSMEMYAGPNITSGMHRK